MSNSSSPTCSPSPSRSSLVVLLSGLIGVPAALCAGAARLPGKKIVMLLFLLPLLVPPITYGIPLATVALQARLAGQMSGVVLANLVPTVPFVILVMIPFIEQIDTKIEAAARVFRRQHLQALHPCAAAAADARHSGRAAAGARAHHRDVRADLPDRRPDEPDAGGGALLRRLRSGCVRAVQSIDAMAVIYMVTTLVWLVIALRFVNPTQIVGGGGRR